MTSARKGNRPVRLLFVEMDASLKAEQTEESARDMQSFCAIAERESSSAPSTVLVVKCAPD